MKDCNVLLVLNEESGNYHADGLVPPSAVIATAKDILAAQVRHTDVLSNPKVVADYLVTQLAELEYELFAIIHLDIRHRLITYEEMFRGTLDGASVHSREVVKAALAHNAAAVILTHNHPSGDPSTSEADKRITKRLKEALALVDIRVLDHIVVAGAATVSFAERGLL